MAWSKHFTRVGRTPVKAMTQTARNGGLRDSVFVNRDDPDYKKYYGRVYSEKQLKIIHEEVGFDEFNNSELGTLIKKAASLGDFELAERLKQTMEAKKATDKYKLQYTPQEAETILQSLTPWQRK